MGSCVVHTLSKENAQAKYENRNGVSVFPVLVRRDQDPERSNGLKGLGVMAKYIMTESESALRDTLHQKTFRTAVVVPELEGPDDVDTPNTGTTDVCHVHDHEEKEGNNRK